jgi:hypothetical protein
MINQYAHETTTVGDAPLAPPAACGGQRAALFGRSLPRRSSAAQVPPHTWRPGVHAEHAEPGDRTTPVGQGLAQGRAQHPVWGCRDLGVRRVGTWRTVTGVSEAVAQAAVVGTTKSKCACSLTGSDKNGGQRVVPARLPFLMPFWQSGVGASRPPRHLNLRRKHGRQ